MRRWRSFSAACVFGTVSSGDFWQVGCPIHALNKSMRSPASFVRPSYDWLGTYLAISFVKRQLSRMMTTSMLALLSSIDVGEDGEDHTGLCSR